MTGCKDVPGTEIERANMAEYFGELLDGFTFTQYRLGAKLRFALC